MNFTTVWETGGATLDKQLRRLVVGLWMLTILPVLFFLYKTGWASHQAVRIPAYATSWKHIAMSNAYIAVMFYGMGLASWWALVAGRAVLLQRDLRSLQVPAMDRTIFASLALQYLLSVLLPSLLLTVIVHLEFARTSAFFTLCVTGALLFQVLPRVLGPLFGFLPALMLMLNSLSVIPGLRDPAFLAFGWTLALAFAVVVVWRWRTLLKADANDFGQWSVPTVMLKQSQLGIVGGFNNFDLNTFCTKAKKSGTHKQVRLDGIGPATPVAALRVWLGTPFFAPLKWSTYAAQSLYVILPFSVLVVFLDFYQNDWKLPARYGAMALGIFGPLLCVNMVASRLSRLYADTGGELALLATLPGLGDGVSAKRRLLLASAGRISLLVFVQSACCGLVASLCEANAAELSIIAAATFAGIALNFGIACNFIGGRGVSKAVIALLSIFGLIAMSQIQMSMTSRALHLMTLQTPFVDGSFQHGLALIVFIGWLLVYVMLMWLGLRGWRAYRRRPHPFLLNS
jgi:hypothetical protein